MTPLPGGENLGGKLVMGMWLPASERHFVEMIERKSKVGVVRGRGTYQKHKLDAAMKRLPADRRRVAVDVGAHVGLWSVWLCRMFQKVIAFEPVGAHADLFALNVPGPIEADETIGAVDIRRVALGDHEGTVSMNVPGHTTGNATVTEGNGREPNVHGVPLVTLDSFNIPVLDFLKIDVEGYELSVLKGAAETIRRCRPLMVIEQKGNDEKLYHHARNEGLRFCIDKLGMKDLADYGGDHIVGWA